MVRRYEKLYRKIKLLPLVIMLVGIPGLLVVSCGKETPVSNDTQAQTPAEESSEPAKSVLQSSLAGTWYPADEKELRTQIEDFFQQAQVTPINNVIALILPHAGYQYSGQVAACGLKTTDRKYKRIVVIGPSHRVSMQEILSIPNQTYYQTPLGEVPLDVEFINKLLKYPQFQNVSVAHQYEHSVQIELPLLQYCQDDFKFVPIVAGQCSLETIQQAAAVLKGMVDRDTLVIASSDFTHYGPNYSYVPFSENIPEKIKELDMGAYKQIANLDAKGFLEYKDKTGTTICGSVPIAILLSMLSKQSEVHLVKYATSGEQAGDFTNSVSYLSAAFSGQWEESPEVEPQAASQELTEEDKEQLLTLARQTMMYAVKNRKVPQVSELDVTISDAMKRPGAAFVTLKKNSQLRGCIGDIIPQRPLYMSVLMNAINACFNDRRFLPVQESECGDITIEISALTVPQPVASPDQIRIGIDGVILSKDGHSAVFLPQVAPEQSWNVDQMLTQLSLKAQLPADAWKDGASFQVFQAIVFGENEK